MIEEGWCGSLQGDQCGTCNIHVVVRSGSAGISSVEERSVKMKVLFGKRLEGMEESGLVKVLMEKLREAVGIGC